MLMYGSFSDACKTKSYGKLFYFCRGFLRLFNRSFEVIGEVPAKPAVYIGHHQNLKGALRIMMWLNTPVRIWSLGVFCNRNDCYNQYASYTLSERFGWPKIFVKMAAFVFSLFVPALMKSMRAIPVYRNSPRDLRATINETVESLCNNENILILPDIDYADESDFMGEMYAGFIRLDDYYYAKTGKHLSFVPLRQDLDRGKISIGKASTVQEGENYARAKRRIAEELRRGINSM